MRVLSRQPIYGTRHLRGRVSKTQLGWGSTSEGGAEETKEVQLNQFVRERTFPGSHFRQRPICPDTT